MKIDMWQNSRWEQWIFFRNREPFTAMAYVQQNPHNGGTGSVKKYD